MNTKNYRMALAVGLLACAPGASMAQQADVLLCNTHDQERIVELTGNDPLKLAQIAEADDELELLTAEYVADNYGRAGGGQYVIPVVFHIIHNNGPENSSNEQVIDAVRVLNDDFNKLNADWDNVNAAFLGLVADVGVQFRLATKDPFGNCTNGITRTVSTLTYQGDQDMKDLVQWPRNKYLNVWVAASADGAAGYTFRPNAVSQSWAASWDGIVLLHNYTGSIGTSAPSRSRTLTHEVGHWINLAHTWGNSNEPGLTSNCNGDDNVSDTPNTIGWTSCSLNGSTCGSLDNVENYMEYSYCSKMFTEGQKQRMLAALNSGTAQRNQLWQPSNLAATGVLDDPVVCQAAFSTPTQVVCAGDSVRFFDESFHGIVSWDWDLTGASPATSSSEDPVVVYDTPGLYPVGLTVGDGNNTVSTQQSDYILVLPSMGQSTPYSEGFEGVTTLPNNDWYTLDATGNAAWEPVGTASFSGNSSVRLDNYFGSDGDVDELISTTVDLSNATDVTLSFRWSFAQRNSSNDDVLQVYVSADCGATWSLRKNMRASTTLTTAGVQPGFFTPSSASQWEYMEVTSISSFFHVPNFRFKFVFENDGGNNLYIDDINLNGTPVGVEDLQAGSDGLKVVPDPARDRAELWVEGTGERTSIQVLDPLGRVVRSVLDGMLMEGPHKIPLRVDGLRSGMYLVQVTTADERRVVRFTLE